MNDLAGFRTDFWHRLRWAMFIGAIFVAMAGVVSILTIVAGPNQ